MSGIDAHSLLEELPGLPMSTSSCLHQPIGLIGGDRPWVNLQPLLELLCCLLVLPHLFQHNPEGLPALTVHGPQARRLLEVPARLLVVPLTRLEHPARAPEEDVARIGLPTLLQQLSSSIDVPLLLLEQGEALIDKAIPLVHLKRMLEQLTGNLVVPVLDLFDSPCMRNVRVLGHPLQARPEGSSGCPGVLELRFHSPPSQEDPSVVLVFWVLRQHRKHPPSCLVVLPADLLQGYRVQGANSSSFLLAVWMITISSCLTLPSPITRRSRLSLSLLSAHGRIGRHRMRVVYACSFLLTQGTSILDALIPDGQLATFFLERLRVRSSFCS
eukprot:746716-Hanusia_phi.AAC.3